MNAKLLMMLLDLVEVGFRTNEIRERLMGKTDEEVERELDVMLAEADRLAQEAIDNAR